MAGNTLYGTTASDSLKYRTVFTVNTDGAADSGLRTSFSWFDPSIGAYTNHADGYPLTALTASDSTLFGVGSLGGSSDTGAAFTLNTNGTGFMVIRSFAGTPDGAHPNAAVASVGTTVYGTTSFGGTASNGAVFQLNSDGSGYALLKSFSALVWDPSVGETHADSIGPATKRGCGRGQRTGRALTSQGETYRRLPILSAAR